MSFQLLEGDFFVDLNDINDAQIFINKQPHFGFFIQKIVHIFA